MDRLLDEDQSYLSEVLNQKELLDELVVVMPTMVGTLGFKVSLPILQAPLDMQPVD